MVCLCCYGFTQKAIAQHQIERGSLYLQLPQECSIRQTDSEITAQKTAWAVSVKTWKQKIKISDFEQQTLRMLKNLNLEHSEPLKKIVLKGYFAFLIEGKRRNVEVSLYALYDRQQPEHFFMVFAQTPDTKHHTAAVLESILKKDSR